MLKRILTRLFLICILLFFAGTLNAEDKTTEEIKISEADKKALEEKEKALNLAKEQDKNALENARNLFKYIKTKNQNGLKKLLSIPFFFDEEIIYSKKGIEDMLEEIDTDDFPVGQTLQFSIDKKSNEYTENNIVVVFKDNNIETEQISCIWIDRDSQKIIGLFVKGEKGNNNAEDEENSNPKEEPTKKKLAPKKKKADATDDEEK